MIEHAATTIKPSKAKAKEILTEFWTQAYHSNIDEALAILEPNPWLMKERAPKSVTLVEGNPFLQAAILEGLPQLVLYGLEHGAPLEDRCPKGITALPAILTSDAIRNGKNKLEFIQLVDLMMDAGAKVTAVDNTGAPIWMQASYQPIQRWENLIRDGVLLDFIGPGGWPGLSLLLNQEVNPEKIKLLVRRGANVNFFGLHDMEKAPLMRALFFKNLDIADFLLAHGADLALRDAFERSFLHHANTSEGVSWLVRNGLDLEEKDVFNRTPLLHMVHLLSQNQSQAIRRSEMETVAIAMILKGADLQAKDDQETSLCARDLIKAHPRRMAELNSMLYAIEAREVAMRTLAEME